MVAIGLTTDRRAQSIGILPLKNILRDLERSWNPAAGYSPLPPTKDGGHAQLHHQSRYHFYGRGSDCENRNKARDTANKNNECQESKSCTINLNSRNCA